MAKRAPSKRKAPALFDVPIPFAGSSQKHRPAIRERDLARRRVDVRVQSEEAREADRPRDWRDIAGAVLGSALAAEAGAFLVMGPRWGAVIPLAAAGHLGWRRWQYDRGLGRRTEEILWRLKRHKVLKDVPRLVREEAVSVSTVNVYWDCRKRMVGSEELSKVAAHVAEQLNVGVQAVYFDPDSHCVVMRLSTGKLPKAITLAEFLAEYARPEGALVTAAGPSKEAGEWVDHARASVLVSGGNGRGKSNVLRLWAADLMSTHGPEELKIAFLDMKAGAVEFSVFRGQPHVLGIASSTETARDLLKVVAEEIKSRERQFSQRDHSDIDSWNRREPDKLARILVFIDEPGRMAVKAAASRSKERDIREEIETQLGLIAQGGRAAGVRVVVATQLATVETLPSPIRNELTTRLAFKNEDVGSQMGLGGKSFAATRLPPYTGRAILSVDGDEREVQVPLLERDQVGLLLAGQPGGPESERPRLEVVRQTEEPQVNEGDVG